MNDELSTFVEFIVAASGESHIPEGQQKHLIRGFYEIVANSDYEDEDLEKYLNSQGYDFNGMDKLKVRNLHNSVDLLWPEIHDTDY